MPVVKKVRFGREEEFNRLKMGRLVGEDAAEAKMHRCIFFFLEYKARGSSVVRYGAQPWRGISRGEQTKHFSALITYIANPETDDGRERLGWMESRNVPGMDGRDLSKEDAKEAAFLMGATAGLSRRLQKRALIHYIVSFHPGDTGRLNHRLLRNIADQCLHKIGAERHQALIGCHIDRNHIHIHIALNRVHPVTEKPLNEFRDLIKLEQLMRRIEQTNSLTPVQGRHFDLNGARLPPYFIGKPRKRPLRANALGSVRRALEGENPFKEASSWEGLHQRLSNKGMEARHSGTRIEIGKINTGPYVPAEDLFGECASTTTLENRFDASFTNWQREEADKAKASKMGLRLDEYLLWTDELQIIEKAKVRQAQTAKKNERIKRLMEIASRPAREAVSTSMYQEKTWYYGPAISYLDILEAMAELPPEAIKKWHLITRKGIRRVEVALENLELAEIEEWDLKDALVQMGHGLKSIERYARHRGISLLPAPIKAGDKSVQKINNKRDSVHR